MKIVAIDFETANSSACSACSLGICTYEDGSLQEQAAWLMRPAMDYCEFTNTFIHGITADMCIDKPEFSDYYPQLKEILKDAIVIAHNARFDLGVLNALCDHYGLEHFQNAYFDTVIFARKVFPFLKNHKLNTISDYLGLTYHHHEAQSDAYCCMMIVLKTMEFSQIFNLNELLTKIDLPLRKNF